MRTLLSLMLAIFSLPVAAEELQFDLRGLAAPSDFQGEPTIPFEVKFTLNTLSGTSSFSFSYPQPCVTAWHFGGPLTGPENNVTDFLAIVGGQIVVNQPGFFAEGDSGDVLARCLSEAFIAMDALVVSGLLSETTIPPLKLNRKDPLGDLLLHSLSLGGFARGFLDTGAEGPKYSLDIRSMKITPIHGHDPKASGPE